MTNHNDTGLDDLMVATKFLKRYPDLITERHFRWLVFQRENNGLAEHGAVLKRAGRWYVDVPRFRDWLLNADV
jgi:methylase of polypeptide subunit release factors